MKLLPALLAAMLILPLMAQTAVQTAAKPAAGYPDPFGSLSFLQGNWEAKTDGTNGVNSAGTYTFRTELGGHILARRATSDVACTGPASFDCEHHDILYVYQDAPGQSLKAIYFDNEGHVLYYSVSTPDPVTVVFLSDSTQPGPQFQLIYQLQGVIMFGKFQMRMPGQKDWKSYLEWSGAKKT